MTLAMILVGVTAPAEAVQATPAAECTFSTPMHFSPGISPADGTGLRYASDEDFRGAERGVVECIGTLGDPVTGPGTFGFTGKWTEGNCEANKGSGRYSFTVPTTGGTKHFVGSYSESRVGLNGTVTGTQPEGTFTGAFHIIPTGTLKNMETCQGKPITQASIILTGLFAS
jgi:hypothetical protein